MYVICGQSVSLCQVCVGDIGVVNHLLSSRVVGTGRQPATRIR